jgi:hypothetical protein
MRGKTVKKFYIYKGTLLVGGLCRIIPKDSNDTRIGLWFDKREIKDYNKLSITEFNEKCEAELKNLPY